MSRIAKLPAGFRQVEYIESHGKEYINTEFAPNNKTRVIAVVEMSSFPTGNAWFWGSRQSADSGRFSCYMAVDSLNFGFHTTLYTVLTASLNTRYHIDMNGNVCTVNGTTVTGGDFTFANTYNLALFGENNAGSVAQKGIFKMYSCQIYDDGTLVRDYVPCINLSGVTGLYDLVNSKFYGNSGTGAFTAGRKVYEESEVKKLEYIKSNGNQYVNTEFKPNSKTRVEIKAKYPSIPTSDAALFGVRSANVNQMWAYYRPAASQFSYRYGNSSANNLVDAAPTEWNVFAAEYNVLTVNGTSTTATEATFEAEYPMFIFGVNNAGTFQYPSTVQIAYSRIYDSGMLARDYYPAEIEGEIGLWDALSGIMYTDATGGTFIAGPEIGPAPSTPSDLEILEHTDTSVMLGWNEVANAFGYRVYKNGGLYAEQTATEFSDEVTPYQSVEYGVSAYNDKGESKTALLVVYISPDNPIPYLITDRKQADADRIVTLASMGYESMTDTERAEWDSDLKGAYNASDLNRVEKAVAYLAEALRVLPIELREYAKNLDVGWDKYFDVPYGSDAYSMTTKENWALKDVPTPADMERYLANVVKLRNALKFASDALPQTMNDLRWQGANAIESALKNLDAAIALFKENTQILIINTAAAWAFSGEVFMGEV